MTANSMTAKAASRGKLFVVATPIGNLDDLTPRARAVLAAADVIAAEDTRHTRGLLSRIGVEARLIAYHEHNERERVAELLERLESGATVALVSDAGTPLISDPGWRLVRSAREQGIDVVPVPGPSAAIAALCAAGLPTDRFVFEGFLPRTDGARATRLRELRSERRTLVFYESVHRVPETLAALIEHFGVEREAVLARELTKIHEQIRSGTLGTLAASLGADVPLLGEFVLVVAGSASDDSPDTARAQEIYATLAAELDPSKALQVTSTLTGISRNELYKLLRT
jgi:16S rRNA (cytidine1402-2'-O)-methyltransferase